MTVCVLGKGGDRGQLGIPPQIDEDVEYLQRLPYPVRGGSRAYLSRSAYPCHPLPLTLLLHPQEFWGRIHNSFALVPAFGLVGLGGQPVYYESRISSTIVASLITGILYREKRSVAAATLILH